MPSAFVLINTELGLEDEVKEELVKIPGVKEAYPVYGVYDLIVKVEVDTDDELKEMVTYKIRGLDKVRSTLTMVVHV